MSRSPQRAATQRAYFEDLWRMQNAGKPRFGNAAEIVEDVPTLTDVVLRGGAAAARRPHKPEVAGSSPAPATNKFRNVKTNGYASKKEARRGAALRAMARAGDIRDLVEQPRYLLIPKQDGERKCEYVADFAYTTQRGEKIVEDCKGIRTRDYIIKRKLMLFVHRIRVREV